MSLGQTIFSAFAQLHPWPPIGYNPPRSAYRPQFPPGCLASIGDPSSTEQDRSQTAYDAHLHSRCLKMNYLRRPTRHRFLRRPVLETLEWRCLLASVWQNSFDFSDVNNDHAISALDALHVINAIGRRDSGPLEPSNTATDRFYDTNGDSFLSAIDALIVINDLGRNGQAYLVLDDLDNDLLSDRSERDIHGTDPGLFDTDFDLLPDGVEVRTVGLDPLNADDSQADLDADNLNNLDEVIFQTKLDDPDTDGDGANDSVEAAQGSDPLDSMDHGQPPNADDIVEITLVVGDDSGSHSERWELQVGSIRHQAPEFGKVREKAYKFLKGKSYPISIIHRGTNRAEGADYDYTARVEQTSGMFVIDENQILGSHSTGSLNTPFLAAGKQAFLHVPKLELQTVSFHGTNATVLSDIGSVAYDAPHWEWSVPDANEPLSFDRNSRMSVSATIAVTPAGIFDSVEVRAEGPSSYDFEKSASVSGNIIRIEDAVSRGAFPDHVDEIDLQLSWEVHVEASSDNRRGRGKVALDVGTSRNQAYVTFGTPKSPLIHESLLDIGGRNASGLSDEDAVVAAIWSDFQNPVPGVLRRDGEDMTYWKMDDQVPSACHTLEGLLETTNGSCAAWSDLFVATLEAQGLDGGDVYQVTANSAINPDADGFLVKSLEFVGNGKRSGIFNYELGEDVFNLNGIKAQGNKEPRFEFGNHFVVKRNGAIYDPSYGSGPFASEIEHENAAIDGIRYKPFRGLLGVFVKKNDLAIQELLYVKS